MAAQEDQIVEIVVSDDFAALLQAIVKDDGK